MGFEERAKRKKEEENNRRNSKLMAGICTKCQKVPPVPDGRMCQECRKKAALAVRKSQLKKRGYDDWY